MEKKRLSLYLWLFKVNFFISAFTFGGGYVVIPMIRKYFVTEKHLFSEDELMDMAAIAQSSPGAIAINLAVMNLLPIPALDGGRIFFLLVDAVCLLLFKRKIPERYTAAVNTAGFVVLMGFMLLVTFHDVFKLVT